MNYVSMLYHTVHFVEHSKVSIIINFSIKVRCCIVFLKTMQQRAAAPEIHVKASGMSKSLGWQQPPYWQGLCLYWKRSDGSTISSTLRETT